MLANHMFNFQLYYKKPIQITKLTQLLVICLQSKIAKQEKLGQVPAFCLKSFLLPAHFCGHGYITFPGMATQQQYCLF